MRTSLALLCLTALLAGCSSTFRNGGEDDSATSGDGGSGPDGSDLPDLQATLETGLCEEAPTGEGDKHPGADAYFVGAYESGSDGWTGTELWLLYANQAWKDAGGSDCVVTWGASATEGSPTACANCDFSLAVVATLDESETTCDKGLWEDELNWSVGYDVKINDDGTSTWYFGKSGSEFASGYSDSNSLNFATSHSCTWF